MAMSASCPTAPERSG
uniref:Uncharacterized protein n=1 Tax=Anguilla anguilla TaxID=7936 RepID=A0A0E9P5R1_ANGAN